MGKMNCSQIYVDYAIYSMAYTYYIYQEKSPSDVKYCFMMSNMV